MSAIAGPIIQAVGDLAGGIMGYFGAKEQAQNQWNINERNIELQREAWAREDNAIQRRMKDLEAAGLSPTLAAGNAAASSGPSVNLSAPESPLSKFGNIGDKIRAARQQYYADQNAKATINAANAQARNADAQADAADAQKEKTELETEIEKDLKPVKIQQELEKLGIMQHDVIQTQIESEMAKKNWDFYGYDLLTKKKTYEMLEQAIKNKEWERAISLSNTLVNAFAVGATAGRYKGGYLK